MPQRFGGPPSIPGVTQEAGQDSQLDTIFKKMTAKPQPAMQHVREAIESLRRAVRLDPKIEPLVGPALMLLTRGRESDDEETRGETRERPTPIQGNRYGGPGEEE